MVGDERVLEASQNGKASEITEWLTTVETRAGMMAVSFSTSA